jgi:Protein of unknown function (DUF4238)
MDAGTDDFPSMARDHFVAQTYLKHWTNPRSGMLRGYGKQSGKEFPCAPKDVCHAWDWDVNPYFKGNPRLLGEYRRIFEPQWNPTIAAVRCGQISAEDKFVLAGYWALLTTCTPTWHAHAVKVAEHQLADFIPLLARHVAKEKPEYGDFIEEALAEGRIVPNPDGQHIKGMLTQQLTRTTLLFYQLDWTIIRIKNGTEAVFITSDNPSSVLPRRPFANSLRRFLPLAPDLALLAVIDPTMKRSIALPDLEETPPGALRHARITRKQVARLNRVTVMNADELVFRVPDRGSGNPTPLGGMGSGTA